MRSPACTTGVATLGWAKQPQARRFFEWLLSPEGQQAIGAYRVDGQQLFHPSAAAPK